MAKKASPKSAGKSGTKSSGTAVARSSSQSREKSGGAADGVGDAFIKLLQSPLVAELVAVAATAALAALAEHGFTTGGDTRSKRAGKAVKEAGKAAAAAVGRRLSNELDEIRTAAKESRAGGAA